MLENRLEVTANSHRQVSEVAEGAKAVIALWFKLSGRKRSNKHTANSEGGGKNIKHLLCPNLR